MSQEKSEAVFAPIATIALSDDTETHHYSGGSPTTWNKERDGLFRSESKLVRDQLKRKYKIG